MSEQQSNEQTVVETVETKTYADVTPYAVHMMVNAKLKAAGVDVKTSSQSMYSRASHGAMGAYKDANGKWWFDGKLAAEWMKSYVDRYVNGNSTSSKVDYEALAAQYEI